MNTHLNDVIDQFLNRWSISDIEKMTLEEYLDASSNEKHSQRFFSINTFCYWVEYTYWLKKNSNTQNLNAEDFLFNSSLPNYFGIIPLGSQNNESSSEDDNEYAIEFSPEPLQSENAKPKIPVNFLLYDNEGLAYEEYTLDEEINKESFYVIDNKILDTELADILNNGYTIYSPKNTFINHNENYTDCELFENTLYKSDEKYKWISSLGETHIEAFQSIKAEILKIIQQTENLNFNKITASNLSNEFAWKIAYLYSEDKVIPIFDLKVLKNCAEKFGYICNSATNYSELQSFFIDRKPNYIRSSFEYAQHLLESHHQYLESDSFNKTSNIRKAVEIKNTHQQIRKAINAYTVEQRHNILQNELSKKLINQHGKDAVRMEENFVDIKLFTQNQIVFYEVKSDGTASACIRNALGQVLNYVCADTDPRRKKIVIVGEPLPTKKDLVFISFLKSVLNIEFDYENISLDK